MEYSEEQKEKQRKNQGLVDENIGAYDKRLKGVRVGDFVVDGKGKTRRIAHVWREGGKAFQWQTADLGQGHYYLGNGSMEYSGGLDSGFQEGSEFKLIGSKMGDVWVFDEGFAGAGRGVDTKAKFRLFNIVGEKSP